MAVGGGFCSPPIADFLVFAGKIFLISFISYGIMLVTSLCVKENSAVKVRSVVKNAVVSCALIVVFVLCSVGSVSALTPVEDLPVVHRWMDGAAQAEDGQYLHDTWAVDKSGVAKAEYVLINQDSTEVFRVNSYPADVNAGNTITVPQYTTSFELSVPEGLTEEVLLTVENDACSYTVSLLQDNGYKGTGTFYPGEYTVTAVEVPAMENVSYGLTQDAVFVVSDDKLTVSMGLKQVGDTGATVGGDNGAEGEEDGVLGVDVAGTINGFDRNGDLLQDTVFLALGVIVLFAVYGIIKYRRKKKEELNR